MPGNCRIIIAPLHAATEGGEGGIIPFLDNSIEESLAESSLDLFQEFGVTSRLPNVSSDPFDPALVPSTQGCQFSRDPEILIISISEFSRYHLAGASVSEVAILL